MRVSHHDSLGTVNCHTSGVRVMDGVLSNVWVFASHVKTHVEMEGITSNVNLLTHVVHLSTLNVNS